MNLEKDIRPFPFGELVHYSKDEVDLQHKVLKQYAFLEDSKDFFGHFLEPLKGFLADSFQISLQHVVAVRFDELKDRFSHKGLYSLIKVLPQNKTAFFSFDPLLAKMLVTMALSGGKFDAFHLADQQAKPLTTLEEGVVEYLVVSCLEQIEKQFHKKDFSFVYDSLLSDAKKLTSFFSNQDEFAVFSFLLAHPKKDFHFHLVLPLGLGKELGWDRSDNEFLQNRLHDFLNFKIPFQLEVGHVQLSASDFSDLNEGDIILLDETSVEKTESGLNGAAILKSESEEEARGYEVSLKDQSQNFIAEIKGVL